MRKQELALGAGAFSMGFFGMHWYAFTELSSFNKAVAIGGAVLLVASLPPAQRRTVMQSAGAGAIVGFVSMGV